MHNASASGGLCLRTSYWGSTPGACWELLSPRASEYIPCYAFPVIRPLFIVYNSFRDRTEHIEVGDVEFCGTVQLGQHKFTV